MEEKLTRFGTGGIGDTEEFCDQTGHLIVVPIRQGQNQFFIKEVGIWIFRVVHDQRASEAIWVLAIYMGMVPVCARLLDLFMLLRKGSSKGGHGSYGEIVGKGGSWRNRTLGCTGDTIHMSCAVLIETVEMDGG